MTDPLDYDGDNPVLKEVQRQTRKGLKKVESVACIYPGPERTADYILQLETIVQAILDQQNDGISRMAWIVREARKVERNRSSRK